MIAKLEVPNITYVHTTQETIPIHAVLEKTVGSEMMKSILKARAQMVESMYMDFDSNLETLTCSSKV
jgi:hypothetical protein